MIGFNKDKVHKNSLRLVNNFNSEIDKLKQLKNPTKEDLNMDSKKINWTSELEKRALSYQKLAVSDNLVQIFYRPFTKKWELYDRSLVHRPGKYFKQWGDSNKVIVTTGRSASRKFSVLVSKYMPDYHAEDTGQGFMRYNNENLNLIDSNSNLNHTFLKKIGLSENDAFAYVYGLLNSKNYQSKYANDLRKDLARIPIAKNKDKYVKIGKQLMNLHINYEEVDPYEAVNILIKGSTNYTVQKMKFAKKRNPETNKLEKDRSTIIFNDSITISNIPDKAYQYIINGRSAIEWIMDQYRVKTDKKSGITDDPNDFSDDPKYIFNLLLSIINVSVQTVDLINQLPKFEVDESFYKDENSEK